MASQVGGRTLTHPVSGRPHFQAPLPSLAPNGAPSLPTQAHQIRGQGRACRACKVGLYGWARVGAPQSHCPVPGDGALQDSCLLILIPA